MESTYTLDFSDVLIHPKPSQLSSRSEVNLLRKFNFPVSGQTWEGIPIIAANMDTTGTFQIYKELKKHKMLCCLHKHYVMQDFIDYGIENFDDDYFMISTGISDSDFENLNSIMNIVDSKWICIDIANGYMRKLVDFCQRVRKQYPNKIIIAGNIVCGDMTQTLIKEGLVDIVKVGIGGGSACLTRMKTGVGVPQLTATMMCAAIAQELGGYIISDGGITCPGDMSKAFGGGADFVMAGGIFAGHDENPGELIIENNKQYKLFYGMSSSHAMNKYEGSVASYRTSEGRRIKVPYRGKLESTIFDYLGGIRSTCTYINAQDIESIRSCCKFVMVKNQLNKIFA